MSSILKEIEVTESTIDSSAFDIKILNGEFAGVVYRIGEVSFPDEDEPLLRFSYDIVWGDVDDIQAFEKFIGDSIVEMLKEQLAKGEAVFKGGI